MADLKYYDGANWVTLKGSGVALSTVGVEMTDCNLAPAGANGSFTADGTDADGTKKYKLNLNLPRVPIVTASDTSPSTSEACEGDLWIDTSNGSTLNYFNATEWLPVSDSANIDPGNPDGETRAIVDPQTTAGRLSFSQGDPLPNHESTGSVLYYIPYSGNLISLWNGEAWAYYTLTEISLDISGLAASTNYDVFVDADGDDLLALTVVAWADVRTRAEELGQQTGIYVKSGSPTKKYLGTIRTTTAGVGTDTPSQRLLWNQYNRRQRDFFVSLSRSHDYNGPWRPFANVDTVGETRVEFVVGLAQETQTFVSSLCRQGYASVALNNSTTPVPNSIAAYSGATGTFTTCVMPTTQFFTPGYNWYLGMENGNGASGRYSSISVEGVFQC